MTVQSIRRCKGLRNEPRAVWPISGELDYASDEISREQEGRELLHDDSSYRKLNVEKYLHPRSFAELAHHIHR